MTLKAKVEAVVYAADDPVTLAQLAAIFANEVLEELQAEAHARESAGGDRAEQQPEPGEAVLWTDEGADEAPTDEAPTDEPSVGDEPQPLTAGSDVAGSALETEDKKAARLRTARVRDRLQLVLDELIAAYADSGRGMEIREIAGGYRMTTKPEYHDAVRSFVKNLKPPMKLSLQALETLAVVAYKQPVTAPEISEIRGVDSGGVLGNLIGRKLLTTAGRKHVIGRPILYKTTKEFLLRFGLKDLNELPSMEEFEKMAGELAQAEAEAEDAAMRSSDLPQASPEPVTPFAGSDTGEGEARYERDGEHVTSLNIAPSPPPASAERNSSKEAERNSSREEDAPAANEEEAETPKEVREEAPEEAPEKNPEESEDRP